MPDRNYASDAEDDARETVDYFSDEIVEQLVDRGNASDDLFNDYGGGDGYHHETHVDRSYSLLEAATLLDQLSEHEETDSALWEGQDPRDAVATQAGFTYGNAVLSEWNDLIREINDAASEFGELNKRDAEAIVRAVVRREELPQPQPQPPEEWRP